MIERPIIFSAPMVRGILDGSKTQTRRVVKLKAWHEIEQRDDGSLWPWMHDCNRGTDHWLSCPYGKPGARLWVRENGWERPHRTPKMMREGADTWAPYYYDADGISEKDTVDFKAWGFKRRPSIYMPRWASRILLEVTDVRVERLLDIDEAGCIAEGCSGGHGAINGYSYNATPNEHFRHVWESIGGRWTENPWVWAVSFRRIKP